MTKVATGAVGAAEMLAGGPSAMGAGAMAGAIVGDLVTNKVDGTMEHRQQKEVRKADPRFTDTDQDDEKRTDLKDVPLPVSPPTAKGTVNMDTLAEHARRGNERVNRHFSDSD